MTERTFRSPSPNRPGSSSGPSSQGAPPVPPLPEQYGDGSGKGHRRSSSLDPIQRVFSPPPKTPGGRGVSLDRAGRSSLPPRPKSSGQALGNINEESAPARRPKTSGGPVARFQEPERADSRNSLNFSYPLNARPNSPPPASPQSPTLGFSRTAAQKVTSNPKPNGITAGEMDNVQQSIANAANAPVKKKKKQVPEGIHLASGSVIGKPMGTATGISNENRDDESFATRQPTAQQVSIYADDPEEEPQPPTEDVADTSRERQARRAAGLLNKQPSIVREDWEGEEAARTLEKDTSPVGSPVTAVHGKKESYAPNTTRQLQDAKSTSANPPALLTTIPSPELGLDKPSPKYLDTGVGNGTAARPPSQSPSRSRSARFSTHLASELSAEARHEPPPRSVSPAKSAMKQHSPASPMRAPVDSAHGTRFSSYTPSEASDNTSLASADGFGPGTKKKKSARVSFDAEPEVVGTAVSTGPTDQPGSTLLNTIPAEDDMEEVMKPRPALPSFGSVRGKRDGVVNTPSTGIATSPASVPSSTNSSVANVPTMETSVSSDHAIGSLLSAEAFKQPPPSTAAADPNLPLPPEVTSIEGTGYVSDSDGSIYDQVDTQEPPPPISATLIPQPVDTKEVSEWPRESEIRKATSTPTSSNLAPTDPVPQIAIQPATPGLEGGDRWLVNVPGGFPEAMDQSQATIAELPANSIDSTREPELPAPKAVGVPLPKAEPVVSKQPDSAPVQDTIDPRVTSFAEALRLRDQEDGDNESAGDSSIYSDAAEDLSDTEGDGFGSINAIVESPIMPGSAQRNTPPESPLRSREEQRGDWNQAQTHWSNLAQRQRENIGQMSRVNPPPTLAQAPKPKTKKKKKTKPTEPEVESAVGQAQSQQPAAIRKSMRPQSVNLDDAETTRSPRQATGLKSSMRPSSVISESAVPSPSMQARAAPKKRSSQPATGAAPKPNVAAKSIERTMPNDDSDSSTSFRRRTKKRSPEDRVTMRRSMRVSEERPQSAVAPTARQVRSLSPPENRLSESSAAPRAMRSTMRGSIDSGRNTLRSKQPNASGRTSSMGVATMRPPAPPAPSPTLANRFKSRFSGDLDDEKPKASRGFRSRFDDSSDDEPEPLRPVRGIPRKVEEEEDSTDLDDSSDEGATRRSRVQISSDKDLEAQAGSPNMKSLRRRTSGSGRDLGKSGDTASPSSPKKKGLFGRFRSKRGPDDSSRVGKSKAESPARRDTHLERNRAELERARAQAATPSPAVSLSQHGKLQRRHIPARVMSDGSWPLPPKITGDEDRPSSAGGPVTPSSLNGIRPEMTPRQETSSTLRTEITAGGTPVSSRTGKKKRFLMLRKAFGLND